MTYGWYSDGVPAARPSIWETSFWSACFLCCVLGLLAGICALLVAFFLQKPTPRWIFARKPSLVGRGIPVDSHKPGASIQCPDHHNLGLAFCMDDPAVAVEPLRTMADTP